MRSLILVALYACCACSPSAPRCRDHIAAGELVISELFASYKASPGSGGGDGGHQWFEIFNASERALDLAGLEIVHTRASGTVGKHRVSELALAPAQYATLGDEAPGELAPYLDYGFSDELGAFDDGGGGTLSLSCDAQEIGAVAYGASKLGHAREITGAASPSAMLEADPASWCDATSDEYVPGNFGTPRAPNDCIPAVQCRDHDVVRAIMPPTAGQLVITEVMASPTKVPDAAGEWLEVTALADVDLDGIALDRVHDTLSPDVITSDSCLHVGAGEYVVFARSADANANGGLPAVTGTFRFALVAGSASTPGDARILSAGEVIDAVEWTHAADGASLQLDRRATDAVSNDDPAHWCASSMPYGAGDLGSPGAANAECP